MFQIGDKVVYGIQGICVVSDLEQRVVDRKRLQYLVLEPIKKDGSRFLVPIQNEAAMAKLQKLLTREELSALLNGTAASCDCWIEDENARKQKYRELITHSDRRCLAAMVHALYQHRSRQLSVGRKVHLCDENFLRDAEKLLSSETAVVMDISWDEALLLIRSKLK